MLAAQGRFEEAIGRFETVLSLEPNNAQAAQNLEALREYQRATEAFTGVTAPASTSVETGR